jgi:hypothetical protein
MCIPPTVKNIPTWPKHLDSDQNHPNCAMWQTQSSCGNRDDMKPDWYETPFSHDNRQKKIFIDIFNAATLFSTFLDGWRVVDCFASPLERQQLEHVTYFSGKALLYQKIHLENHLKLQENLAGNTSIIDTPTGDIGKRKSHFVAHSFSILGKDFCPREGRE